MTTPTDADPQPVVASTSEPAAASASPADIAVAFTQILRGLGLSVPTSCTHTFAAALCATGLDHRDATYWAGRATLVRRMEDIALYDRAFAVFFEGRRSNAAADAVDEPLSITIAVDTDDDSTDSAGDDEVGADDVIELRFSATEILRNKDFADYSPDELAEAQELMSHLRLVGAPRSSLRRGPTPRRTSMPDIRRTVRSAIRAGGEPIERHHLAPRPRLRRLVLLLDVSGSMEPYAERSSGSSTPPSPAARRSRHSRSEPASPVRHPRTHEPRPRHRTPRCR